MAAIQPYFSDRLGLAVGLAATGSSQRGILYPVIFISLIDKVGFAWTTRIIGFIALGTLAVPLTVSHARLRPSAARKIIGLSAFKDGPFMICILGCFLGYAGSQVAFFYVPFFAAVKGWMNLTSASPGSILIIGVALLCKLAVHNAARTNCTALSFGFLSGLFVATPPLLFMLLTEDKSKLGSRMGLAYALLGLAVLPRGPGAGGVLQHDPSRRD